MEATGIKEGDVISVKLLEIDERTGKMRLSRRALLEKPENWHDHEQQERRGKPSNNDRRRDSNRHGSNRGKRKD
jgi:polyribonucleotide nucleotidyltransferase